jgi:hypothetical protein
MVQHEQKALDEFGSPKQKPPEEQNVLTTNAS